MALGSLSVVALAVTSAASGSAASTASEATVSGSGAGGRGACTGAEPSPADAEEGVAASTVSRAAAVARVEKTSKSNTLAAAIVRASRTTEMCLIEYCTDKREYPIFVQIHTEF